MDLLVTNKRDLPINMANALRAIVHLLSPNSVCNYNATIVKQQIYIETILLRF
jgi:hypothetical protein